MEIIYDFSALPEVKEVMDELTRTHDVRLAGQSELAQQPIESLEGKMLIASDERFLDKSDDEIIDQMERFSSTGLRILYIAGNRGESTLADGLSALGAETYFIDELTLPGLREWLDSVLFRTTGQSDQREDTTSESSAVQQPQHRSVSNEVSETQVSRAIVVSGAAGAGSTFVALQLAKLLSEREEVHLVEAGIRPCLTTWLGSEPDEADATLQEPLRPSIQLGKLDVYTRNPMGEEVVSLRSVKEHLAKSVGTVVYDLVLQDYMASMKHSFAEQTTRILVTTSDLHRCRYLEGIPADVVVVNQVPHQLPVEESEFAAYWPGSTLVFVPYEADQTLSIVQGQPVITQSTPVRNAVEKLACVNGGDKHANDLVG